MLVLYSSYEYKKSNITLGLLVPNGGREWIAYSSGIKIQWTFTLAKKKQTLRAWKRLSVQTISRIVRAASHGNCTSHLTRGHGDMFELGTRFDVVQVLSVPSLSCMVECRKDCDSSPFFPLLSQTIVLCGRKCCCSQCSTISVATHSHFTTSCFGLRVLQCKGWVLPIPVASTQLHSPWDLGLRGGKVMKP